MNKQKSAHKAARPRKTPRAQSRSITLAIPDNVMPLLAACSSFVGLAPEIYAREALYALLLCDADYVWFEAVRNLNGRGEI